MPDSTKMLINAWEVEDGEGEHGVENPATWADVGAAILGIHGPRLVRSLIVENHDDGTGLATWDFSDPDQLGNWLVEGIDLSTCAWHMPTEVYLSDDEDAWKDALSDGRVFKQQSWDAVAPEGYTRIVWVTL